MYSSSVRSGGHLSRPTSLPFNSHTRDTRKVDAPFYKNKAGKRDLDPTWGGTGATVQKYVSPTLNEEKQPEGMSPVMVAMPQMPEGEEEDEEEEK